ncbi:MAG: hypothetical protein JO318_11085, partial [Chloroflexi bacterium]|nr:hypothetical protein [Chloroflexota bacterium]
MFSRIVCVILAVVLAFAAAPVFAGPQVWTSNGPSEQVLAVALNPNDENALLASGASG